MCVSERAGEGGGRADEQAQRTYIDYWLAAHMNEQFLKMSNKTVPSSYNKLPSKFDKYQ